MIIETTTLYSDLHQGSGRLFPLSHLFTEQDSGAPCFTVTVCLLPGPQVDTIKIPQEGRVPPE